MWILLLSTVDRHETLVSRLHLCRTFFFPGFPVDSFFLRLQGFPDLSTCRTPYCHRGEVNRGTTLIALARILAALYRERPPESSSGCSELAAIKARRRASTFPLLSKGCCLMLGSSLQKPILQIFYHKLRQCQPLSRNFTKNSIFRTALPRAARSSLPEPASEALPESASAAFSAP